MPNAPSRLKRPRQPKPSFIRAALSERDLMDAYRARPAYQQNDYLSWITRAKLDATRQRRLGQMLAELRSGDRYMKMRWQPRPNPLRLADQSSDAQRSAVARCQRAAGSREKPICRRGRRGWRQKRAEGRDDLLQFLVVTRDPSLEGLQVRWVRRVRCGTTGAVGIATRQFVLRPCGE